MNRANPRIIRAMLTSRKALLASAAAFILLATPGCGVWRSIFGSHGVDLSKATVQSMSVDIRKQNKTICPREHIQMAVFAKVLLEGETAPKDLETWEGKGNVDKSDHLDFPEFAFHSEQGAFDNETGWFAPNPSILATVDHEFELTTVYKQRPDLFTLKTKYKPDYQCIKGSDNEGQSGGSGSSGTSGQSGKDGSYGSDSSAGGDGGDGGQGSAGGDGSDGAPGPHLVVFATMVKTAFYDKLVAVKIGGDATDFVLIPIDHPIQIVALGGAGGSGGDGGAGGHGGSGGSGNPGGNGGNGGQGGTGGKGGNGGAGGAIELTIDSRFAELTAALHIDASGGSAGGAGSAGSAGNGGSAGSPISPSGQGATPAKGGSRGTDGTSGASGSQGHQGANGKTTTQQGDVKDQFNGMSGITVL